MNVPLYRIKISKDFSMRLFLNRCQTMIFLEVYAEFDKLEESKDAVMSLGTTKKMQQSNRMTKA